MGYFRNPEIKKEGIIWLFAVLLTAFLGWYLASVRGLYLCLFCAVIFAVIHFSSSVIRYRKIAGLADEVQHFLHVFEYVDVGGEKEGELAILRTEIRKMMNKLNHQANLLMEDKKYLLNSIADISHQIRTPLTAINLIVSRLWGEKNEADRQRLLHELEQLLVHMDWLIEALLKMAKLDAGTVSMKKKTVNVSDLLKKSVQDFLIPMELREQNLVIDCTDMVSLRGDEYWLREAVGNIVKNAWNIRRPVGRFAFGQRKIIYIRKLQFRIMELELTKKIYRIFSSVFIKEKIPPAAVWGLVLRWRA